jgi:hypothetical protein
MSFMTRLKSKILKRVFIVVLSLSLFTLAVFLMTGKSLEGSYTNPDFSFDVNSFTGNEEIFSRVLLIGDAGAPSKEFNEPVLEALKIQASKLPEISTVLFLGDNIYPTGLPDINDPDRKECERRINEQVEVLVESDARGIIIPGNHDWDRDEELGWKKVVMQEKFINDKHLDNVSFLPKSGCPGPEVIDLNQHVRLILFDTQWWLHEYNKPDKTNSKCFPCTEKEVIDSIDSAIKNSGGRFVIAAAHHPIETYGQHGGYFEWKDHIFPLRHINENLWIPLPVIGSLYPLLRNSGISPQDLSHEKYQSLKHQLEKVFSKYPSSLIYASGHEHTLQVLKGISDNLYLISGYGTSDHNEGLQTGKKTLFAASYPGFMQIDFFVDGRIKLDVYKPAGSNNIPENVLTMWIKQ